LAESPQADTISVVIEATALDRPEAVAALAAFLLATVAAEDLSGRHRGVALIPAARVAGNQHKGATR